MNPVLHFLRSYWPVAVLAVLVLLPRLWIHPGATPATYSNWSGWSAQVLWQETALLLAGCILLSGLLYWWLERLGYRFVELLKIIHLGYSYPFFLILAVGWYYFHYHNQTSPAGESVDQGIAAIYAGTPEWLLRLHGRLGVALLMFVAAQLMAVVHLAVVLWRGQPKQLEDTQTILDRFD